VCAGSQGQDLFVAFQVHSQSRQNDGRIGLICMPNAEVKAIEVHNAPMGLQRTLSPRLKLVSEALIETTDRAGTGSDSHEGLSHFPDLMRTRSSHKHLRQSYGDVRLIATAAVGSKIELSFSSSYW